MELLSVQATGALCTALLFLVSLIASHALKLARIGYRTRVKRLPPEQPKAPEQKQEPVYFIVERKKKRSRTEYTEPKRISFQ